jgi:6-pyruvoyltetrahydropterin/6-carboxytetrahydropterin synthase
MLTCRKSFTDIPFAHRQPHHDGHCAFVHGHNWTITLTFACRETDDNGFVVDFGGLGFIREWIQQHLDHAMVFSEDDPLKEALLAVADVWKPYTVPNSSCEGLACHLYKTLGQLVRDETLGRAWVVEVEVTEDSKNSATYRATQAADCPYRDSVTR